MEKKRTGNWGETQMINSQVARILYIYIYIFKDPIFKEEKTYLKSISDWWRILTFGKNLRRHGMHHVSHTKPEVLSDTTVLRTFLISCPSCRSHLSSILFSSFLAWHLAPSKRELRILSLSYIEEFAWSRESRSTDSIHCNLKRKMTHLHPPACLCLGAPADWVSVIEFILHGLQWSNHPRMFLPITDRVLPATNWWKLLSSYKERKLMEKLWEMSIFFFCAYLYCLNVL